MPTATALKYHTCSERFQCTDCNKLFMQKSTLVEHQAVAHRPRQPTPPPANKTCQEDPRPEIQEQKPEPEKSKVEVIKKPRDISALSTEVKNAEVKKPAEVIKKLVDDWDEDEDDEMGETVAGDSNSNGTTENGNVNTDPSVQSEVPEKDEVSMDTPSNNDSLRPSVDKSEELDEDQIVADVDDILNDTDNIINDVDSILSGKSFKRKHDDISDKSFLAETPKLEDDDSIIKTLVDKKRPTVQCEECYECFEDQEKLAWHSLNDH